MEPKMGKRIVKILLVNPICQKDSYVHYATYKLVEGEACLSGTYYSEAFSDKWFVGKMIPTKYSRRHSKLLMIRPLGEKRLLTDQEMLQLETEYDFRAATQRPETPPEQLMDKSHRSWTLGGRISSRHCPMFT